MFRKIDTELTIVVPPSAQHSVISSSGSSYSTSVRNTCYHTFIIINTRTCSPGLQHSFFYFFVFWGDDPRPFCILHPVYGYTSDGPVLLGATERDRLALRTYNSRHSILFQWQPQYNINTTHISTENIILTTSLSSSSSSSSSFPMMLTHPRPCTALADEPAAHGTES